MESATDFSNNFVPAPGNSVGLVEMAYPLEGASLANSENSIESLFFSAAAVVVLDEDPNAPKVKPLNGPALSASFLTSLTSAAGAGAPFSSVSSDGETTTGAALKEKPPNMVFDSVVFVVEVVVDLGVVATSAGGAAASFGGENEKGALDGVAVVELFRLKEKEGFCVPKVKLGVDIDEPGAADVVQTVVAVSAVTGRPLDIESALTMAAAGVGDAGLAKGAGGGVAIPNLNPVPVPVAAIAVVDGGTVAAAVAAAAGLAETPNLNPLAALVAAEGVALKLNEFKVEEEAAVEGGIPNLMGVAAAAAIETGGTLAATEAPGLTVSQAEQTSTPAALVT